MDDTAKYLIHASITADGVVERSDVVGAIFGQTEGLLGDDLDLRDLQQSSKVGRIDVEVDSEHGESRGRITIASSLDKVETSILAASLETITRVGPCRATVTVTDIEDIREAKRREVVERAKELLASSFDGSVMTSAELLEEVRESARVEDISEYHDLPAGPRVADSDAIIIVEGRADVLRLLRYGIKNAVAVEGTNVPASIADLTHDRTVTAFLDGDRGGELILRELAQVGDVDYVAFAPEGSSVEDLSREDVLAALRQKIPFERLPEEGDLRSVASEGAGPGPRTESQGRGPTDPPATPPPAREADDGSVDAEPDPDASGAQSESTPPDATAETDGAGTAEAPNGTEFAPGVNGPGPESGDPDVQPGDAAGSAATEPGGATAESGPATAPGDLAAEREEADADRDEAASASGESEAASDSAADSGPAGSTTLRAHVREIVGEDSGRVRLLDDEFEIRSEADAADAFDEIEAAESVPYAVVLDGELSQRILDVAAQRGVGHVVARSTGEFVKKPVGVRTRTFDQLSEPS